MHVEPAAVFWTVMFNSAVTRTPQRIGIPMQSPQLQSPQPIEVVHLFPEVLKSLLDLLRDLSHEDWGRPTACAPWTVKDVAAHLLGGDVGILSRERDGYAASFIVSQSWDELVAAINQQNALWVDAAQRMSPLLLCDLLQFTGEQVCRHFAALDPTAVGNPVDWAGAGGAPIWLDLAREYTERWHHQQHIRDAVDRPGLTEPRYLAPVLDTFVRALPQAFDYVDAPEGSTVALRITGAAGGSWLLQRREHAWRLFVGEADAPRATVELDQELAWRLFTKGLDLNAERHRIAAVGEPHLVYPLLNAVAIIA